MTDILFFHVWWEWSENTDDAFSVIYHWLNIVEGIAWFVFSCLVGLRWLRYRRSQLEFWYSAAFAVFGVTDFVEAWQQSSPLIWVKLVVLITLFLLRRTVMSRHYPQATLY